MNEQLTADIMAKLDAIGAKLGVAAEALWEILIRQSITEGTFFVTIAGFFLVLSILLTCIGWAKMNWREENSYCTMFCVGLMMLIITCFICMEGGARNITKISNPRYHAFCEIGRLLK